MGLGDTWQNLMVFREICSNNQYLMNRDELLSFFGPLCYSAMLLIMSDYALRYPNFAQAFLLCRLRTGGGLALTFCLHAISAGVACFNPSRREMTELD